MGRYLLRRIPSVVLVLVVASFVGFSLPRLAPGDPAVTLAGPDATLEQIEAIRSEEGLDENLIAQYFDWVKDVASGDLGTSILSGRPVSELISSRLATTVELAVVALIFMLIIGATLGVIAGSARNRYVSAIVDSFNSVLLGTPPFLVGLIFILIIGVELDLLPFSGSVPITEDPIEGFRSVFLPALALALPPAAAIARLVQAQMRKTRGEQFVELAVAKGVPSRRISVRHVLRNSTDAGIVLAGIRAGELLAGAVVIEAIFARNGLGQLAVQSVQNRDYQVVQVIVVGAVAVALAIQLLTEILLAALDPRIRLT
ncbi:MAG: ABC transporter permease [Ilumatobacteraceae bacterium]|nr:ABC transporter permease [Ilumatobacteraceae bacterium]